MFDPWIGKIPWRREWQPTLVFLSEEVHGQRGLMGPRGFKESDTTEQLTYTVLYEDSFTEGQLKKKRKEEVLIDGKAHSYTIASSLTINFQV